MSGEATTGAGGALRWPLNSQDRFLLLENEMLEGHALPGLQCQTHVWLAGRLDEDGLRAAIGRLAEAYPVTSARLVRTPEIGKVRWEADPGGSLPLDVVTVADDSEAAALAVAESWLRRPIDLASGPLVRFVLVRRPATGDVLVVPYSHVLMDGKAPEPMLLEMDREGGAAADGRERTDEVGAWLRSYPRRQRILGMSRLVGRTLLRRTRDLPVLTLAEPGAERWAREGNRIHVRTLDPEAAARLRRRVRGTIGFESLAPALLASAFRAVAGLHDEAAEGICRTYVPITLRATPGLHVPIFCNLSSVLTLAAERRALADRDALVRELHGQMRRQIRTGQDVAVAQAGWWLTQQRRPVAWRFVWRRETWTNTLGFGWHGAAPERLERFLGVPVERLYTVAGTAHPPGACLSANESGGALHLGLTREAGAVPAGRAERFLDALVADLLT